MNSSAQIWIDQDIEQFNAAKARFDAAKNDKEKEDAQWDILHYGEKISRAIAAEEAAVKRWAKI